MSFDRDSRVERWLKCAVGLIRLEPHLLGLIHGLGEMDADLCGIDDSLVKDFAATGSQPDYGDIQTHVTHSYLWVLGAYEVIRTLSQKMDSKQTDDLPKIAAKFKKTKQDFARVRVPLAKFEPASKNKQTDSHIAFPGFSFDYGVAWQVSEKVIVSRRELSDSFLEALESMRSSFLSCAPAEPSDFK